MKLRVIALMTFLFAGNAVASSVQLICEGYGRACAGTSAENASCHQTNERADIRIDEEAGTVEYEHKGKWQKGKKVEFSEAEISAKFSGSFQTLGGGYTLIIDRFTGTMEFASWNRGWSGQCRAVDVSERKF